MNTFQKALTFAGLVMAGAAQAQGPAILRGDVLTLPDAVVIDDAKVTHYRNVKLTVDDQGRLQVQSSEEGRLANVESAQIMPETGNEDTVDVVARGFKSSCVSTLHSSVTELPEGFLILITESDPGDVVCALVAEPFEITTTLDVSDREEGEYIIQVNNTQAGLEL